MSNLLGDVEAPTAAEDVADTPTFDLAKYKFAKYAATFYHQARKEGKLDRFFLLINEIYKDRWPADVSKDALEKVRCQHFYLLCTRHLIHLISLLQ